jgi:ubiquinone/menaquinone biosynthesis C-methylase UbiE
MRIINPIELFLWTFRRNEKDVVSLYNSLSGVMQAATGGKMLNFGYWDNNANSPILAQKNLCTLFGKFAKLDSAQNLLDVGSGFGAPALQWIKEYKKLQITCVNVNSNQLYNSIDSSNGLFLNQFEPVHATSTILPFRDRCIDRVLALESAQHFKPLEKFLSESRRILTYDGIFAMAIPVMTSKSKIPISKLGTLSFTWSSEHYDLGMIKSLLHNEGYKIIEELKIGSYVYEPLTDYYLEHRNELKNRILLDYPSYVEQILVNSLIKMKKISQKKIIDYLLISCKLN